MVFGLLGFVSVLSCLFVWLRCLLLVELCSFVDDFLCCLLMILHLLFCELLVVGSVLILVGVVTVILLLLGELLCCLLFQFWTCVFLGFGVLRLLFWFAYFVWVCGLVVACVVCFGFCLVGYVGCGFGGFI